MRCRRSGSRVRVGPAVVHGVPVPHRAGRRRVVGHDARLHQRDRPARQARPAGRDVPVQHRGRDSVRLRVELAARRPRPQRLAADAGRAGPAGGALPGRRLPDPRKPALAGEPSRANRGGAGHPRAIRRGERRRGARGRERGAAPRHAARVLLGPLRPTDRARLPDRALQPAVGDQRHHLLRAAHLRDGRHRRERRAAGERRDRRHEPHLHDARRAPDRPHGPARADAHRLDRLSRVAGDGRVGLRQPALRRWCRASSSCSSPRTPSGRGR